mgnify:CR=1 FL=1
MDIRTVGIVGAGQMGNGIAHVFALSGYEVLLNDISDEGLKRAVAIIDKNLERQASRGKITEAARAESPRSACKAAMPKPTPQSRKNHRRVRCA